ncbi:metallophosphoesterase [Kitasatospora sp. NBC_01287]|uniref:metallophosphoesterase family protein n=1 Tax=Kitasatospora sp. NBC_01287 TaxID=2903573 RepID=UPI00225ABC04|nr:metallophosphoesterase [Kitasatospora sp. NBC_01287]MCX4744413.1 metallophosphoesterase [Kitasatospora sp. NBC_01287]
MRILHLSDTHLDATDAPNANGVNATESLRRLLADLASIPAPDAIVVSGDLADAGAPEAYTALRALIGGFAATAGAPVVYSTGNHDERAAFTRVLGSGHLGPDGAERAERLVESAAGERAAVSLVGGYRFVTLDTLVPGKAHGLLGRTQLDWLREVLSVPAPQGSVLVLHHPPVALDVEVQRGLGLQNPEELAEVVRGSDVRIVLCGHYHLQLLGFLAGVPTWVTPGVVSRVDLTAPVGTERAVRGAGASLIELGGPHSPLIHTLQARDPHSGEPVYDLDRSQLRSIIERFGPGTVRAAG